MAAMADKTRIAIVGAGHVAQVAHIPAYRANPDVELVAVVDDDPVKARRIKEQFGFKEWYEDISGDAQEIRRGRGRHLHAQLSARAHGHSRPAFGPRRPVRKALARDAKEAQRMVDDAEKHDRILMAAMNNRFREDVQMLQQFVEAQGTRRCPLRQGRLAAARH